MSGSDHQISGSKIDPLASESKHGVPHAPSASGVTGSDHTIDQSRINPLGEQGVGSHVSPHADSQGVVGRDEAVQASKIDPLKPSSPVGERSNPGLDDESVDTARIDPMGSVRE